MEDWENNTDEKALKEMYVELIKIIGSMTIGYLLIMGMVVNLIR